MKHHPALCYRRGLRSAAALLLVLLGLMGGCREPDASELPVWSPTDHDNQSTPGAAQVEPSAPRPEMAALAEHGVSDVILATWRQKCARCHGIIGRGDGPEAAAYRPRDLTDPTWQRVALDSEITHTIQKGRGRMPAFKELPAETVEGLVRLVRLLDRARQAPESEPGAAP
jgi:mono/diheme cytochrome c family protein